MEVDSSVEVVVPTEAFESVIHPSMPINSRKMIIDPSIEAKQVFDIFPEPGDMKAGNPLDFIIHETPGYFLDTSSISVDVKLKLNDIRQPAGERVARGALNTYFINNLVSSLWKTVKVSLNNTNIESNFHHPQLARLNHLLTTPDEISKRRGVPQGVFPIETDSGALGVTVAHLDRVASERVTFATGNTVHVRGPLNLDVSGLETFMLDGVNMKVTLEPISSRYLLNQQAPDDDAAVPDYELVAVKLMVTKVKPATQVLLATKRALVEGPVEYLMRRKIVDTPIIPQGVSETTCTRPFQALIPAQIYVWFVDLEASNGAYHLDPFYWSTLNMTDYTVRINGVQVAGASSCGESLVEPYLDSLDANGNHEHFVPYSRFDGRGCCVLCINTNNGSDQNALNLERRGNLVLHFKFGAALDRPIKMYVAGAVDSTFEVDAEKTVVTNFQY